VYDDELKDYAGTSATEMEALNKSAKETVTTLCQFVFCNMYTAAGLFNREQFKRSLKRWLFECAYGKRCI